MEKKRKLPARAAARVEHISKKRTVTPPDHRSETPAPAPPTVKEPSPPPPLPKSIQAGKPLPTVEEPQPSDLPARDYQSVQERQVPGVLAESLHRSRQKWISEGIFEKYWSKPSKRKGVVIEEPNNPGKDTMMKLGQVTITVEPHIFEATMFAIKDPKRPLPTSQAQFRPIIQYGPPNGTMPPPPVPTPASTPSTPALAATQTPTAETPALAPTQPQQSVPPQDLQPPPSSLATVPPKPTASPRGVESVLSPDTGTPQPAAQPAVPPAAARPQAPPPIPTATQLPPAPAASPTPSLQQPVLNKPHVPPAAPLPPRSNGVGPSPPPGPARAGGQHPPGTDPIIVTLAEKATEDPQLRDLMKRVANGQAPKDELERFQAIIDQITAESRRKGVGQGPSADRLLVDGRTVRYFAEEVRAILDIVFTSNPKQTSADLRPPARSDPLVVSLVKAALDDAKIKDMVRRIAENRPHFSDATDLKLVLDRLRNRVREHDRQRTQSPAVASTSTPKPNGHALPTASAPAPLIKPPPQQSLRSKGPPPVAKPDFSAVVIEFAGGSGDRYLFPKFSVLEYLPSPQGQQVIASFLIVRKGSMSEYGGDPDLDYYQPVTIRLYAAAHRHLETLAKVVAPVDEVRRYMDDVMDNMTRAEYVLLAMRLPRKEKDEKESSNEKDSGATNGTNGAAAPGELQIRQVQPMQGVLWTAKATATPPQQKPSKKLVGEDDQYQNFITSITPREVEDM